VTRKLFASLFLVLLIAMPAWASNDPGLAQQWGMQKIGAQTAWQKSTGEGIVIAVIDTGIYFSHEDLNAAGKFVDGKDYIDEEPPQDRDGHGTHVAGIAAALTGNGRGVAGVAPNAKLMSVRVLNEFGVNVTIQDPQRLFADTADAVRWATDHGARVINMSFGPVLGSGEPDPDYASALAYAWSKGVVPVVAAGNDDGAPSGFSNHPVLVVVATTSSDAKAGYSNTAGDAQWGVSAPGSSIYSTYCCYLNAPNATDGYESLSGTSMAAPHVSGAAASLMSLGLNNQQTVNRIISTTRDLGSPGKDSTFGHGLLDLAKAVQDTGGGPSTAGGGSSSGSGRSTGSGSSGAGTSAPGSPAPGATTQESPAAGSPEPSKSGDTEEGPTALESRGDKQGPNWTLIILGIAVLAGVVYFAIRWFLGRRSAQLG
jgi:subtilisin family serine protease